VTHRHYALVIIILNTVDWFYSFWRRELQFLWIIF